TLSNVTPPTVICPMYLAVVQNQSTGVVTLAKFTQASATKAASAYSATVNWGDGTTDDTSGPNVSIQVSGSEIGVQGTHTFATLGSQQVVITIHGLNDNTTAAATTTIYVANPLSVLGAASFTAEQNVSTGVETILPLTAGDFKITGPVQLAA